MDEQLRVMLEFHQKIALRTNEDYWSERMLIYGIITTPAAEAHLLNEGLPTAWSHYYKGVAAWERREHSLAVAWMQKSLDSACEEDDKELMHRAGTVLGKWCSLGNQGTESDALKSVECFKIAMDAASHLRDDKAVWSSMWHLGEALLNSADFEEAHKIDGQLTAMAEESKQALALAYAASLSASIAGTLGEDDQVSTHNEKVLRLLDGFSIDLMKTYTDFIQIMEDFDNQIMQDAAVTGSTAWTVMDAERMVSQARGNLSSGFSGYVSTIEKLASEGSVEEAQAYAAEFLKEAQAASSPLTAMALVCIAQVTGPIECRLQIVESLLDEAERTATGYPNILVRVLNEQGMNFMRGGENEKAILSFRRAAVKQVELDKKFGGFGSGRIAYFDWDGHKRSFRALQALLMDPNKPDDNEEALVWAERERCRDLLHSLRKSEKRDAYIRELAGFDSDKAIAWEEIQQVARLAGKDTAILVITRAYFEMIYTHLLHWDGQQLIHKSSGRRMTNGSIPDTVENTVSAVMSKDSKTLSHHLQFWYEFIIKRYEDELKPLKKLVIVPHEEFSVLPFSAFYEAEGKPYLIETHAISFAPSLRMYKQCVLQQKSHTSCSESTAGRALVIGNPTFDLECAGEEAKHVAGRLSGFGFNVVHLQGPQATKHKALNRFLESHWIHVASHSVFNDEYPNGALRFGSSSSASSSSRRADLRAIFETRSFIDELLTGEDIEAAAGASPLKASAVVLSACSTGLGRIRTEGVLGLTRTFHLLGVPCVLASLWKVDDEATGELMQSFYEYLGHGFNVSEGFQKAMVDMINEKDELGFPVKGVRHWAPFAVYGSNQVCL